jgi:hypothetical protein
VLCLQADAARSGEAAKREDKTMADKNGLGFVGLLFGGITFAMTLISVVVVQSHIQHNSNFELDAMAPQSISFSAR